MITGHIKNKKFTPDSPDLLNAVIAKYEGKTVVMDIRKLSKKRTDPMNRYYWGVVIEMISEETGESPERIHDLMKAKFLGYDVVTIAGEKHPVLKESKVMTTEEFSRYIRDIVFWAGEFLHLTIPEAT